jgi:TRAP-type C4-dicarboxylate transport system permease small subunit
MALLMGAQVFSRYVLNHSIFWSEEVGRMSLVWLAFLGASAAYKRRLHIGIDFLVRRFPSPLHRFLEATVILASLVFFAVMIWYGLAFTRFVVPQKTAALGISQAVPYTALPLSGLLFMLHGVSHLLELFADKAENGP